MPTHTELPIKRTIYTLVTDDYAPKIRTLTMPLMQNYARKIGAELVIMTERNHPEWPVTIEKFNLAKLAKERGDEWSIFIDADCLISPEFFDPTVHMTKAEVAHNGKDFNGMRWKMDPYLMRDGRWIGSCTWFVIASDWTVEDLWTLPTVTPEEAFGKFDEEGRTILQPRINPTIQEHNGGACHREHLIDDYTLSRNIARFGLKFTTLLEMCQKLGFRDPQGNGYNPFLWHIYSTTEDEKLSRMLNVLSTPLRQIITNPQTQQPMDMGWGLMDPAKANEFREEWKLVRR